ncbi:hypothetical protein KBC03_01930 [Patescibacteria group bacterium]|nr:hypothetical protein [Patescibacteria group bacterium]
MKKGVRWFIIFAVVVTALLYFVNSNYDISTDEKGEKIIAKVDNTRASDLTARLALYQSGTFEKVTVINDTLIEGYQKSEKTGGSFFPADYPVVYYNVFTSEKPENTTLKDLGVSLTGSTPITATTEEGNTLSKIFMEDILPLLFFLIAAFFLLRFFGPK